VLALGKPMVVMATVRGATLDEMRARKMVVFRALQEHEEKKEMER